jgi:hypothetical protein
MAIGAATTCLLGVLMAVLRQEPDYYRERMPAGDGGAARARRFITEVAGLQAAIARPGRWDAAFEEREINAWLATDLPANHARLLPTGVAEPRVRFVPGRIDLAVRVGPRLASAVLHLAVQVHLRGESQLALPRDAVLAEVGRRLGRLGGVTSLRRLDGRSVLVVYIPATHGGDGMGRWLGSLAVVEGSLLVAGETRAGAAPR